ncbi:MAG TPA: S8 family serine peptidase [Stenomitos sp.]
MKKFRLLAGSLILSVLAGCAAPTSSPLGMTPTSGASDFRANGVSKREIVVRFASKSSISLNGYKVRRSIEALNAHVIEVPSSKSPEQVVAEFQKNPNVTYADYVNRTQSEEAYSKTPNDPRLKDQYNLRAINATDAWKTTAGEKRVIIAVIDSGTEVDHPDLKNQIVQSWSVLTHTPTLTPGSGHGSHTIGIFGAEANNGQGIAGVAPGCGLMAVQISDQATGQGSDATIAEGIIWAADHGASVMSISQGIYRHSKVLEDALQYALNKDVVICASAGNNNAENDPDKAPHLPSTYPGVIEVAATDSRNGKAEFSNWGKTVTVAAPGVDILSTVPGKTYELMSGTSMAAPCAAGVVGLIRSRFPNFNRDQVKDQLIKTAQDLGDKGFDKKYGYGLVDAAAAVK